MYSSVTPSQRVVLSTSILLKYFTATLNSNSRKKQKNDANNFSVSASSSNLLSQDVVSPQSFIAFEQHIIHATQAWRGCSRIIDSPMPFSYGHLFHLMLFVTFVFGVSFFVFVCFLFSLSFSFQSTRSHLSMVFLCCLFFLLSSKDTDCCHV